MQSPGKDSYRLQFASSEKAAAYETSVYNSGRYGDVLWQLEQALLRALLNEFRSTHGTIDYLDFAMGTGRVLSFMEDLVDTATGIDISEAMLAMAAPKLKRTKIICRDIANPEAGIEGQYDFITAFRFVLNAEPSLRLAAFKALAARLRDKTSWLVFNNHGYLWSYKVFAYPLTALPGLAASGSKANYLTHKAIERLAAEAGLRIDRVIGCGFFSGKVTRLMSFDRAVALERLAARSPLLSRFGVNQIYLARLK